MTIESVKEEIKMRKRKGKKKKHSSYLILILTTFFLCITLKINPKMKDMFHKKVLEDVFPFSKVNDYYKKYFGTSIPFSSLLKNDTATVFHENLTYKKKTPYLDGVKLSVEEEYLVPNLESGMVVFVGKKEGYGSTIIIQQINGCDVWYSNMKNINVSLYDYVEKGQLLGDIQNDFLILVFKKDGKVISYEDELS